MPVGNNANTVASQREYLREKLEETFLLSSVFWSRVQARTDIKPVSSRPSRIPFITAGAGVTDTDITDVMTHWNITTWIDLITIGHVTLVLQYIINNGTVVSPSNSI